MWFFEQEEYGGTSVMENSFFSSVTLVYSQPLPLRYASFVTGAFRYMMYRLVFQMFTPHTNIDGSFFGFSWYELSVT